MEALVSAGIGTVSKFEQRSRRTWTNPHRYAGWTIHLGTGPLLAESMATTPRARIRRAACELDRDQTTQFYSLQRPESYRARYEATPEGFVFSIKGSLSAKGAGWLVDARALVAPLVVNEPYLGDNPIGVNNLLLWT
jgi:hypothetical protein